MRIASSTVYNQIISEIQNLGSSQASLQSEVASGLSVVQPSDDPTAMGDALNTLSATRQAAQNVANATTALNIAQASYSGLSQLNSLSNQVSSIATEAANGTASPSELQTYATQVDQLLQQAVELGNSQFQGNYLYSGTAVTTPPFATTTDPTTGEITAVTYAGNNSQADIPISSNTSVAATTDGTTNQALAGFMTQMITLRDALTAGDSSTIATANTALSASGDTIINATADNSAIQARLESEQSVQSSFEGDLNNTLTNETSANLPTTMIQLNQAETAYQAVLESTGKIMQTSLLDYISIS